MMSTQITNPLTISFFLGIMVVLFCLSSYIFPFGERFKDKTQKIKGFGVDLEVSVITLFILIGFVLTFSGIFLQLKDYDRQLQELERTRTERDAKIDFMQRQLTQLQKMEVHALVTLEGVDRRHLPKLQDLDCSYTFPGGELAKPESAPVSLGVGESFQITLKDISRGTLIRHLVVEDRATSRRWAIDNFEPLMPTLSLKVEE